MKFDLDQPLLDLDGNEILRPSAKDNVTATMRFIARDALVTNTRDPLTPEQSIRRFDLSVSLGQPGLVDLDANDIVLIQQCITQKYGPLVLGQIAKVLADPKIDDSGGK